ncbi:MAG TPA: hypothetical protein VLN45_09250, partial [Ignavibacteriaceae bacterium]|nr:hypothetical protein [Ignavibacteriaceae bacterium]
MKYAISGFILLFLISFISGCASINEISVNDEYNEFSETLNKNKLHFPFPSSAKVDTILIDEQLKSVEIYFSKELSFIPFRKENVNEIYSVIKNLYGENFRDYKFSIITLRKPIEELIPNYFRSDISEYDQTRLPLKKNLSEPIIKNISKPYQPVKGLNEKNILLWPSHGWYYNKNLKRWLWQRARLFQTIEDLGPFSFVIPYL